jgi:hypothetical protein
VVALLIQLLLLGVLVDLMFLLEALIMLFGTNGIGMVGAIGKALVEVSLLAQLSLLGVTTDWMSSFKELMVLCGTNGGMDLIGRIGKAWVESSLANLLLLLGLGEDLTFMPEAQIMPCG